MPIFDYISPPEFYHNVKLKLFSFPSSHVLLTWQVLSENFSDLRSCSQPSIRELTICGEESYQQYFDFQMRDERTEGTPSVEQEGQL